VNLRQAFPQRGEGNGFPTTIGNWLRVIVTVFFVGVAWGVLMLRVESVQQSISALDQRIAHMEKYMEKSSHGDFTTPDDP
jgi:hypothetical protein